MATSGTIKGQAKAKGSLTSNYTFWVEWKRNSYSIENNTSNITVSLKIKCTAYSNGAYNLETKPSVSLSVKGAAKTPTISFIDTRNYVECTFATWTGNVTHNDDGTLSCPISASFTHYGSNSLDAGTASGNASLDTIPRASTITSASDVTLGNKCRVKWIHKSASFRYKLKFAIGNWSYTTGAIHPNKTAEHTYSDYAIPIDAAYQFKKKTGKMTVTLYTYSDSKATAQIGSADSETFTVTVPENDDTAPTVSMSVHPSSVIDDPTFANIFIQGKSYLAADLILDTKYGADVEDSSITVDGVVYREPYCTGYLTKAGEYSVVGMVKDSRGHYGTDQYNITVVPYSKPIVQAASGESKIVAARCDANGNITDSGTYLKIKAKIVYEPVYWDGQNNFGKIQYRYRAEGGVWSDWYTILDTKIEEDTEVATGALLNGALSIQTNYQVQVRAIDYLEESQPVTLTISSANVYMHRPAYGKGMGLGGYAQGTGNLDIYWKTRARGGLSLIEAGEELNLNSILPLPRGPLGEGWNPNDIANGVHEVSAYPLKDPLGNVLMETGVLIQLAATADGFVKIQMAFPTDSFTPVYRIKFYTNWSDWLSFKI